MLWRLDTTLYKLAADSLHQTLIYTIAALSGVFAKTENQAMLNQGARKGDVAASI